MVLLDLVVLKIIKSKKNNLANAGSCVVLFICL